MRYLVLIIESDPDEVLINGRAATLRRVDAEHVVVEIAEDEGEAELEISSADRRFALSPEQLDRFAGVSEAAAQPYALPGSAIPRRSAFTPRVTPAYAQPLAPDAPVAGIPGGDGIPVNYVGEKLTASYLFTNEPLGLQTRGYGYLREFETYWEPLGWALDEWIGTFSLGPFEDTVESGVNVASSGSRETDARAGLTDAVSAVTESNVTAGEAVRSAMEGSTSSRGWSASLGGPPTAATAIPLLKFARELFGTYQFDFGSARTAVSGSADADLRSAVVSHLEQATTRQRVSSNESLARTANTWGESRRLRALRNLGPGKSENLALFSVARQWLVSTVEAPTRPVVLIRAYQLHTPFTARDVFVHRAVLEAGLLDPGLAKAVDETADAYDPEETSAAQPAPLTAQRVLGKLTVDDPAKGKNSVIEIAAVFGSGTTKLRRPASVEGHEVGVFSFEIDLGDLPLQDFTGWELKFVNPPPFVGDARAVCAFRDVEIRAGEASLPVELGGLFELPANKPMRFSRGFSMPVPNERASTASPQSRRVLEHLNAHRPYYRLLIDLFAAPATRAVQLAERGMPAPVDLQPVGVAGVHIAFLTDDLTTSPGDSEAPIQRVLSTPAGGTFLEVLPGRTKIEAVQEIKGWPTVANATLPWPTAVEPKPVEGPAAEAAGEGPKPADAPAAPEAKLQAKLDEMLKLIKELKAEPPKPPAKEEEKQTKDAEEKPEDKA